MNLAIIGPPASGKTIQSEIIAEELNLYYICPKDLVENAEGALKEEINEHKEIGRVIPDELILNILKEKILSSECDKGYVLDGFPTNIEQANKLRKFTQIDKIILINIPEEESINRISNQLFCKNCGIFYNQKETPPKEEFICDICGNELFRRKEDLPEEIRKRLEVYHEETEIIIEKYNLIKINGKKEIDEISEEILKNLKGLF